MSSISPHQAIYVSATPGQIEREKTDTIVEQVIRPADFVDPEIIVKPTQGQVDDLLSEINTVLLKMNVLVTTLTKKWPRTSILL